MAGGSLFGAIPALALRAKPLFGVLSLRASIGAKA
jgi:hypothetical protein